MDYYLDINTQNLNNMNDKYVFFWHGPFSQWFKSPFEVDGKKFNCCEQYMMYQKAITFDDFETAKLIMAEDSPRAQKALGRVVKGYKDTTWVKVREHVVYSGNYHKFTQNPDLLKLLKETNGQTLVEASPVDTIWGIGMSETDPNRFYENKWKGLNLLGKAITRVRENLEEEGKI